MKAEDLHLFEVGLCKDEEELRLRREAGEKILKGRNFGQLSSEERIQYLSTFKHHISLDKNGNVIHESVNFKIP